MKKKDIFIKIGKLLIVVFACVGVLLSGILAVGAIKNAIQKDDEQVEVLAYGDYNPIKMTIGYPQHKGSINLFDTYVFGTNSFMSNGSFTYVLSSNSNYFNTSNINDVFIYNSQETGLAILTTFEQVDYYTVNYDLTGSFNFNCLKYTVINTQYIGLDNTGFLRHFKLNFYNSLNNTESSYYFEFDYIIPSYQVTPLGTGYLTNITSSGSNKCVLINKNNTPNLYKTLESETYSDNYMLGYNVGYNEGHTDGYNEGYNIGSTGMTSNPFNLIKNAFSSIANILNIQVLPNLTLGVLVFAPMVVVVIIAIFKIFRG